jgi:hypothetical protein
MQSAKTPELTFMGIQIECYDEDNMKTSTREWELRRKKRFGYVLWAALVMMVVLVIVLLYWRATEIAKPERSDNGTFEDILVIGK